jgi:caa(3)-type oxidase subunit IV
LAGDKEEGTDVPAHRTGEELRRCFHLSTAPYRPYHESCIYRFGRTHAIDWNTVAALVIAVAKMLLVVLFFMHVKFSPGLTRLVIVAAFFWLAIMIALTLSDVLTRGWTGTPQPWTTLLLPIL